MIIPSLTCFRTIEEELLWDIRQDGTSQCAASCQLLLVWDVMIRRNTSYCLDYTRHSSLACSGLLAGFTWTDALRAGLTLGNVATIS